MRSARILVVDDEAVNIEIIARMLEPHGHAVTGAGSAEEALEVLRGSTFDLIILDLVLPGKTGMQALSEMKTLTDAPIHLMSGQTDPDTRRDALLLGAAAFQPKPLDLKALLAAVAALPPRAPSSGARRSGSSGPESGSGG